MTSILLATRNAHKTREFAAMLGADFVVRDLTAVDDLPPVAETGTTFGENACLKAIAASRLFPGLVVADDSGLEVDALDGAPGVYSARYAGEPATDHENVGKLLAELGRLRATGAERSARFCCSLAVAERGRVLKTPFGTVEGFIAEERKGTGGFGYDPVFIPEGYRLSFAELGETVKNGISHRARAIAELREYLALRSLR
ncbi:MAG: RdgB/HAM1 family non-canonical purine NTP pyrophosphatase [Chthoniobacterales bacterium]